MQAFQEVRYLGLSVFQDLVTEQLSDYNCVLAYYYLVYDGEVGPVSSDFSHVSGVFWNPI